MRARREEARADEGRPAPATHDVRERACRLHVVPVLGEVPQLLDLFESLHGPHGPRVVVVTTNEQDALPDALRRPGRIDEVETVECVGRDLALTILGDQAGKLAPKHSGSDVLAKTGHPARFPLRLARDVVACFSAPGALVCDPFLGSGTTAVACAQLGRAFMGGDAGRAPDGRPWADVALECVGRDGQPRPIAASGCEPEIEADESIACDAAPMCCAEGDAQVA